MANRVPLIVDTSTLNIKELPASDNLDLSSSGLLGVTKICINTAATKNTLEVIGNANISGIVTATTFIGNVTGTITGNATGLTGEPDIIVRNVRATGITTYEDTRNVDSIGIITARSDVHVGAGLSVIGISTFTGAIDANGNIDIAGNTVLNGNVDLGNATSDTITATGRFDSDIVPSTDNARDLGASGLEFKDLYIDGTANIDALLADTAKIGDLTDNRVVIAGSSGELEDDANFTFDGSKLNVGAGTGVTVFNNGNVTAAGIGTFNGGLIVGAGATVGGDLLPEADGTRDLGGSTREWKDLYIDGTANIDSLSADTALIGDLTDNRVVIAGTGGELEDCGN